MKITLSFKGKTVLEDVNMQLQEGGIYGIVGDNGSGKTVLLKLICGFMKPDSGTVTVNGKVIGKDAPEEVYAMVGTKRDKTQYCFSSPKLHTSLS